MRLRLALRLPQWTHKYLLTREEILAHNAAAYELWRSNKGLHFTQH